MVINLAATELVKDVVQSFVQLIHYRTHNVDICPVYNVCDSIDADGAATSHGVGNGSANEPESVSKILGPDDSAMMAPLPPYSSRPLKAKSNLLFAISTFGYQILRYPHFSELCSVTSKLKEGPYADTCGPWKGWPFNTCIVRAGESLDKAAVASATSSIKRSENFRLVRGLIAVGLSAYRGVYTSLGEVSSEVRRVLELLVGQINGKIKAGKDRFQFSHILSQVAYLEDLVNNWVYMLRSLEQGGQAVVVDPNLASSGCPVNSFQNEGAKQDAINDVSGVQEEHIQRIADLNSCHLDPENAEICGHDFEDRPVSFGRTPHSSGKFMEKNTEQNSNSYMVEDTGNLFQNEGSKQDAINDVSGVQEADIQRTADMNCTHLNPGSAALLGDHFEERPAIVERSPNSSGKFMEKKTEYNSNSYMVEDTGNSASPNGHILSEPIRESAVQSKDLIDGSDELGSVKFPMYKEASGKITGLLTADNGSQSEGNNTISPIVHKMDANPSNKTMRCTADSGVSCLYSCCIECLCTLHSLLQKIIIHEWEVHGKHRTVDSVHEAVTSLSVELLSGVRKQFVAGSFSSASATDENLNQGKHKESLEYIITEACAGTHSESDLPMPMHCDSHSVKHSIDAISDASYFQLARVSKFIYRNGVLLTVGAEELVHFHCKFESLCLLSLIHWIERTKKLADSLSRNPRFGSIQTIQS